MHPIPRHWTSSAAAASYRTAVAHEALRTLSHSSSPIEADQSRNRGLVLDRQMR